jgi:endonuclease YncB( thermonuclease family)
MHLKTLARITCLFLTPLYAIAATQYNGTVVGVSDGDTIKVLDADKQLHKVRLYGIDCPEKKQAYGVRAKEFTSSKVFNEHVLVEVQTHGRYGREVAIVFGKGFCLNEELLKAGLTWVYPQYYKERGQNWPALQAAAKASGLGLWADPNPIPPWEFRKRSK